MKGNEALAEAAIRCGADAYFGYPITPQSEVIEYLSEQNPYERTGMVVLQAESELAAINMVYAAGAAGKHVMTSSSSPGVGLKQDIGRETTDELLKFLTLLLSLSLLVLCLLESEL